MAIAYEDSTNTSVTGTSWVVTAPATVNEDELLLAHLVSDEDSAVATINSVPSGWTLLGAMMEAIDSDCAGHVYWKLATASEPSTYTWGWTASMSGLTAIHRFSGNSTASPPVENFANSTFDAATSDFTTPAITAPTSDNSMLVAGAGADESTPATQPYFTTPSTWTGSVDYQGTTGSEQSCMRYKLQTTATSESCAIQVDTLDDSGFSWIVAIKPGVDQAFWVAKGTGSATAGNTSLTPTYPAAVLADDACILSVAKQVRHTVGTITDANGSWTTVSTGDELCVYIRLDCDGNEDNDTVTVAMSGGNADDEAYAEIHQYRHPTGAMVQDATATTATNTGTAVSTGTLTPSNAYALIVHVVGSVRSNLASATHASWACATDPTTLTERTDIGSDA